MGRVCCFRVLPLSVALGISCASQYFQSWRGGGLDGTAMVGRGRGRGRGRRGRSGRLCCCLHRRDREVAWFSFGH
ncbi:hypothetical protein ACIQ2D_21790 [Lysinibacillus sp. NPDC097287]|uniref:hypothetical protein n=1 Tax=Lysinibacillus sp. NPDC097287 TaxID=3364144 RepID=UPI003817F09D